jgi:hypothetical protein
MRFTEITREQLSAARRGIELLQRVMEDGGLELYLFGITKDQGVLESAHETLMDEFDVDEEADERARVQAPTQIAIAIPCSGDTLYYLSGSGLIIRNEQFAYNRRGEGARTDWLNTSRPEPRLTLDDFSVLALADSDSFLDDFLTKHGSNVEVIPPVKRDRPATNPTRTPPTINSTNPIDNFLNA